MPLRVLRLHGTGTLRTGDFLQKFSRKQPCFLCSVPGRSGGQATMMTATSAALLQLKSPKLEIPLLHISEEPCHMTQIQQCLQFNQRWWSAPSLACGDSNQRKRDSVGLLKDTESRGGETWNEQWEVHCRYGEGRPSVGKDKVRKAEAETLMGKRRVFSERHPRHRRPQGGPANKAGKKRLLLQNHCPL